MNTEKNPGYLTRFGFSSVEKQNKKKTTVKTGIKTLKVGSLPYKIL